MGEHLVQFYEDERQLVAEVGSFIGSAVASGAAGVVIATPEHLQALHAGMTATWAGEAPSAAERYFPLDAHATLARFMVDDWPDERRFDAVLGDVLQRAEECGSGRVRAYGEMVALLCRAGLGGAALRVEELWNRLAKRHRFSLLCGYPMNAFPSSDDQVLFAQVCAVHTRVCPSHSIDRHGGAEALHRTIAKLEQKARVLDAEVATRKRAERLLLHADRRKDEFLAMLSHELRNPLAPIRNAVQVLRRVAPPEHKQIAWAADVVDRQAQQLGRLVDDLLDVARISQGKIALNRKPLDLNAVVTHSVETAEPLLAARRQQVSVEQPAQPVMLRGDFARLAQALGNLLNNAAKYSDNGSRIEVRLCVANGEAHISVRDHGIGIDPVLLPSIFELFTQGTRSLDRSEGGLGIGLTLVRRLVELHGGKVGARSDGIGRGSEFEIVLPCVCAVSDADGDSELAGGAASAEPPGKSCRVLIVDDNADAAESIALFLELEGHEVKSAHEVHAALACVPVFAPQVVLLDIGLPVIDGYEVARRMRHMAATRDALIVAVSGYGQPADKQRSKEAGFDHHCVKPTDPQELVELIARWQREGKAGDAAMSTRAGGT